VCYGGCRLKNIFGYDDSLDAFGVHGVGGALGALLVGIFAIRPLIDGQEPGGMAQLMKQAVGLGAAAVFAFVVTYVIAIIIHKTIGMRVSEEDEFTGLDLALHGEAGYHLSEDALSLAAVGHEGLPDARGTGTADVAHAR
jgi:ammonium transporter, Amt family